jgi:hypothetical protein
MDLPGWHSAIESSPSFAWLLEGLSPLISVGIAGGSRQNQRWAERAFLQDFW